MSSKGEMYVLFSVQEIMHVSKKTTQKTDCM